MTMRSLFFYTLFSATMMFKGHASEPVVHDPAEKEVTKLEEQMDRMNTAYRKLRRQVGDASKNESTLELVGIMREVVTTARDLAPVKTADLPEEKRIEFVAGYREQLGKLDIILTAIETALKAGNNTDATKLIGDLREVQKAGHREYKKSDQA